MQGITRRGSKAEWLSEPDVISARVVVDCSGWIEAFQWVLHEHREAQLLMDIINLASDLRGTADVE